MPPTADAHPGFNVMTHPDARAFHIHAHTEGHIQPYAMWSPFKQPGRQICHCIIFPRRTVSRLSIWTAL